MVLVSHKYKFIYIKNAKVAGTSVESFFGKYCIDPQKKYNYSHIQEQYCDEYGIIGERGPNVKNKKWKNHLNAEKIKLYLGQERFNSYLKFCVIRNPYDKMVSLYFFKKSKLPFIDFVKKETCNNFNIHAIKNKSVCDYFIRFEHLEEDIKNLCNKLNINNIDLSLLPKFKSEYRKDKKHWSEYYNDITRKIVYNNHKIEFDTFGYDY